MKIEIYPIQAVQSESVERDSFTVIYSHLIEEEIKCVHIMILIFG